jgi:hypothetical protein
VRALSLALVVTLTLAVVGCGGDESNSDPGPAPTTTSEPTTTVTDPPPTPENECPSRAPVAEAVVPGWRPFVELCKPDAGSRFLEVHNISNTAMRAYPQAGVHIDPPVLDQGDGLGTAMVAQLSWRCAPNWCPIPPGGYVVATGDPPRVLLQMDAQMTGAVVFQKVLAGLAEDRLRPAGQRAWRTAAECAQNIGGAINANTWERQFRYALTAAPQCNSLRKLLFGASEEGQVAERSAAKLISKARAFSGGTWIDALLLAGTHIR